MTTINFIFFLTTNKIENVDTILYNLKIDSSTRNELIDV